MHYCCRMHGEPLIYRPHLLRWICPEYSICGTFVSKEYAYYHQERP